MEKKMVKKVSNDFRFPLPFMIQRIHSGRDPLETTINDRSAPFTMLVQISRRCLFHFLSKGP
jgi:hypothetical protein